jgi:exopolysaccharide biosynthesis polyprenyl glycosylphosphotransferase
VFARHAQLRTALLVIADLLSTAVALLLAYLLRFVLEVYSAPRPWDPDRYLLALPPALLLCLGIYALLGSYRRPRGDDDRTPDLRGAVASALSAALLLAAGALFYRDQYQFSRGMLVLFALVAIPILWAGRGLAGRILAVLRGRGIGVDRALLVGDGATAEALATRLEDRARSGIDLVGRVAGPADLGAALEEHRPDQVFVSFPPGDVSPTAEALEVLATRMVDVRVVPDLGVNPTLNLDAAVISGLPVVWLQRTPFYGFRRVVKRAFDLVAGIALFLLSLPVLLLSALLVLVLSGRPVLYRQERMGLDGRRFAILKLRTMKTGAEEESGAVWAKADDPRTTVPGRWLRRLSLDELPQLVNVVRGDMSLVGPRPERPELIESFRNLLPGYMLRHRIPAGLTGWAQVHGLRGDTDPGERLRYDLQYLERWSLLLDLEILVRTVWHVIRGENAV